MEENRLKYGFLANHGLLVRRLEPLSILPYLVSAGVVSFDENERIRHEKSCMLIVDMLLNLVHRRGVTDPEIYQRLLKLLKDTDATSGQNLEDIVKKIEEDSRKEGIEKQFEHTTGVLEERHNAALRKHEKAIIQGLDVYEVLPHLVSTGVISLDENAAIRGASTHSDQARLLVNILCMKRSSDFVGFIVALLDSESYQGLGKRLSEGDPYLESLVRADSGRRASEVFMLKREQFSRDETTNGERNSMWSLL